MKDLLNSFKEAKAQKEALNRRRATHTRRIGVWDMEIGPIEQETGLWALVFTQRQRVSIQEGKHKKIFNLKSNDFPMMTQSREALIQFANSRAGYLTTPDAGRALKFKSDMETLNERLLGLGVRLPGWATHTK
jgi:hypothetical protein